MEKIKDYIPVGFQYYRAPTPLEKYWESDLKKISCDGFNTVKYWIQWRWSVPEKDEYYFNDIDRLMDLAQENNLKVILNVIFDTAPAWFYIKYPDSLMITNDNELLTPRAVDCRQIGGAPGPCFHHPKAGEYKRLFLAEAVKRYALHPALYCWDLWNEPELTTNIKRKLSIDNLVCYCENSKNEFIKWLEVKYKTIDGLNNSWQRNYRSWNQAELPRSFSTFNDMIDWRLFFIDTVTLELRKRIQTVKEIDKAHPVMCHTVPFPVFNSITCASDDWALAKECDMFGNSIGSNPLPANILTSAATGKKVINSEIHAAVGSIINPHLRPTMNDMLKHIFIPLSKGIEGFIFWQYRTEILGLESSAWGSVDPEGNDTDWHIYMKNINDFLKTEERVILNRKKANAKIGIYADPKNEIFVWISNGSLDMYNSSIEGAYYLFYDLNFDVTFIREEDIDNGSINTLDAIYMPPQFYFNKNTAESLIKWINNGGLVISEPFLGSVQEENGLYSEIIPGYGFEKVFGVKQAEVILIEGSEDNRTRKIKKLQVVPDSVNCGCSYNETIKGCKYKVKYKTTQNDVEVLGKFKDGSEAVYAHGYGAGNAVMLGSLLGMSYHKTKEVEVVMLLKKILLKYGISRNKPADVPFGVRIDVIESKDEGILIINNTGDNIQSITIDDNYTTFYNVFNKGMDIIKADRKLRFTIENRSVEIFKYKIPAVKA